MINNHKKCFLRIAALANAIIILFFSFTVSAKYDDGEISSAVYGIIDYEKNKSAYKNAYIFNSDYLKEATDANSIRFLTALSRFGYSDDYNAYGAVLKDIVKRSYATSDKLSSDKASPWHYISLGLMACGINPQDIKDGEKSIDLIKDGVWGRSKNTPLEKDGPESLMRGLIIMDAYTTLIPENEDATYDRVKLIGKIMSYQNTNGSFSTTSVMSDCEITALAVTALSPYRNNDAVFIYTSVQDKLNRQATVSDVIEKAILYLSEKQTEDGSFGNEEKDNLEVTASVITALCSLELDPQKDERFIKNENTLFDGLFSFQKDNGSISEKTDSESVKKDNSYALEALSAYHRFLNNQTAIFDFSDCDFSLKEEVVNFDIKKASKSYLNSGDLSVDEYEELIILIDKAESSPISKDDIFYLDKLKEKANELYERKKVINELNEQGKYLASPQTLMGSKNTHAAKLFLKQYEELNESDKEKVGYYEEIKEKKSSMRSKTLVTYSLIFVLSILAIAFMVFLAYFFIKSSPLWEYIYMKFFAGDVIVSDDYDDDVVFADNIADKSEKPLPYVTNEDFFDYDLLTDEEDADAEEAPLPYLNDDRNILEDFDEEDEQYFEDYQEEEPLPYLNNEEFFDYEYTEDPTSEDDDFRIY